MPCVDMLRAVLRADKFHAYGVMVVFRALSPQPREALFDVWWSGVSEAVGF